MDYQPKIQAKRQNAACFVAISFASVCKSAPLGIQVRSGDARIIRCWERSRWYGTVVQWIEVRVRIAHAVMCCWMTTLNEAALQMSRKLRKWRISTAIQKSTSLRKDERAFCSCNTSDQEKRQTAGCVGPAFIGRACYDRAWPVHVPSGGGFLSAVLT